jgi:dihydropteroate synthase
MVNDVSALRSDPDALPAIKETGAAVVLMHMQGEPATMQDDPRYDDVLLDVYDHLAARVAACVAAGIPRARIAVDPGIGFGKTFAHNVRLMRNLALFHGLGCAVLLGASRKGFLGRLSGGAPADQRLPASLAAALAGRRQGVQMFRVHDVGATKQALAVWRAAAE